MQTFNSDSSEIAGTTGFEHIWVASCELDLGEGLWCCRNPMIPSSMSRFIFLSGELEQHIKMSVCHCVKLTHGCYTQDFIHTNLYWEVLFLPILPLTVPTGCDFYNTCEDNVYGVSHPGDGNPTWTTGTANDVCFALPKSAHSRKHFFFTQPTTLWCTIYSSLSSSSDSKESSESGINRGTGSMARGDATRLRVFWALFWYCHQGHGKSTVLPRPCQLQNLTPKSTSDVSPRYTSRHKCTWLDVGNGLNIKHRNSQSVTRFAHLLGLFLPWWFLQIMTQAVVSPDYDVRGTRFTTWQSS